MIAYRVSLPAEQVTNDDGTTTHIVRPVAADANTFRVPSHATDDGTRVVRGYLGVDYTVADISGNVRAWERYLDTLSASWRELSGSGIAGTRHYRVFAPVASHTLLGRCKYLRIGRDGSNARYQPTLPLRDMR